MSHLFNSEAPAYSYWTCAACAHVETRPADVDDPDQCENCHAVPSALTAHDDLDAAEEQSQLFLDAGCPGAAWHRRAR